MSNLEASALLIDLYAKYTLSYGGSSNEEFATAVAMATFALATGGDGNA